MKRGAWVAAALIVGLLSSVPALADAQVTIRPNPDPAFREVGSYDPKTVSINVGETVTWTNNGGFPHTITRCPGSPCESGNGGDGFDSGNVNVGSSFSKKFASPGTHNYYCKIHPAMRGTVNVAGAGGEAPPSGGGAQPPAGKSTPSRSRPTPSTSPTTASDTAAPTEAASDVSAPAQPSPSPASTVRTSAESSRGFPTGIVIAVVAVAVAAVGTVMWRVKKSNSPS